MAISTLPMDGIAATIRNGRSLVNAFCSIPAPLVAEMLGRQGFDSVTVDLQHGLIGYETALGLLQAIHASGAKSLCRVPSNDEAIIGKVLDAGFSGIICPMIETVEDAQRLVQAARYPALGRRSWGPVGAGQIYGRDYTEAANSFVTVFAMIETAKSLASLDAILAVEGLDGIYVGPSDLALSLGHRPTDPLSVPQVVTTIEAILQASKAAGKIAGIHCGTPEAVADYLAKGFGLATLATDFALLRAAVQQGLERLGTAATPLKSGSY